MKTKEKYKVLLMENRTYRTNSLERASRTSRTSRTVVNGIELGGHKYVRSVFLECTNRDLSGVFPVIDFDGHSKFEFQITWQEPESLMRQLNARGEMW